MAKMWYPVIDYSTCIECGACVTKCSHGVYSKTKSPTPVVKRPEACVDHCHGCGNICPVGAITYLGEDTGWTPLGENKKEEEAGCSCEKYELPKNLKEVFEGKKKKSECSCGGNC